ncbi:MAG TPA: ArsA-related P-loop ATPase, partial [Acidimicrobiales bacterium]|nr:ArsA-related P-loop ATPase [Acidimicrobiales bacterium]
VPSVRRLTETREIILCCGPGGVGKTTIAASVAMLAATSSPGRVLVLTIDPARRLADALGLKGIGNDVTRIDDATLAAAGATPRGELHCAMLDMKQSWDDLIVRHAPDERTAARILSNPLYQNITGRFVQSHDYIAMERLLELHSTGEWDLIVVDTPPTRNALDFLDAPARMADFFSSRLLRWLIAPARGGLLGIAARPFTQIADRILGTQFLADITEFFLSMQSMYGGFVERARAVSRLLSDERTSFLVVATPEPAPLREAEFFLRELKSRHYEIGGLVLNRALPPSLSLAVTEVAADELARDAASLAATVATELALDRATAERVLGIAANTTREWSVVARREAAARDRIAHAAPVVVTVPSLDEEVGNLDGILALAGILGDAA